MIGCMHRRFEWIRVKGHYDHFDFCAINGGDVTTRCCSAIQCQLYQKHEFECACPNKVDSDFLHRYWKHKPEYSELVLRSWSASLKKNGFPGFTLISPGEGIQALPAFVGIIEISLDELSSTQDREKVKAYLDQAKNFKAPPGTLCFECGDDVNGSDLKVLVYDFDEAPVYLGTAWICTDYPECNKRRYAKRTGEAYTPPNPEIKPKLVEIVQKEPKQLSLFEIGT